MKKELLFVVAVAMFFASCTGIGIFEIREQAKIIDLSKTDNEGNIVSRTHIIFDNTRNNFPVDIFSTHTRSVKINQTTVPGGLQSDKIPWLPTTTEEESNAVFSFYLTYYLPIPGTSIEIPYIPPLGTGAGFAQAVVIFDRVNEVPVHNVQAMVPNAPIINDVGIVIQNNFTTSVQFQSGIVVLTPVGSSGYLINYGQNGFYRVNPANVSVFSIMMGGIQRNLPSEISALQAGYMYLITVNESGTPVLDREFPLTMQNIGNEEYL